MKNWLLIALLFAPTAGCSSSVQAIPSSTSSSSTAFASTTCGATAADFAFSVVQIPNGPKTAVWTPSNFTATGAGCKQAPLIIFSHGFSGCGTQSRFITEELARQG